MSSSSDLSTGASSAVPASDYEAVGGAPAVTAVVDDFYARVVGDPSLAHYFEGVDMVHLKSHQVALVSQVMGGPTSYSGRSLQAAHGRLKITATDFGTVAVHLQGALQDAGVPADIVERTLAAVAATQGDVVSA